jgi:hypothetical protein
VLHLLVLRGVLVLVLVLERCGGASSLMPGGL